LTISQHQKDKQYLLACLELAKKGQFTCRPNPQVGCVIVKDDQIIGEGWHEFAGQGHAEVNAIADVDKNGRSCEGAVAYVSLEPCSFTGKTPPCVDALIIAKISRVVCASIDPNPKVAGQGIEKLKSNGIDASLIDDPEIQKKAEWLNRGFFNRMRSGLPWVMLKIASSMDGRTADYQGTSQWITNEQSRQDVHQLRAQSCAILTGSGTQKSDNPSLNVRVEGFNESFQPIRVLLDSNCEVKENSNIVSNDKKLLIFCLPDIKISTELRSKAIIVEQDPSDLSAVLEYLASKEVNHVMTEAGSTLSASFVENDLVDEIVQYIAPSIIGSQGRGMFDFSTPLSLTNRKQFKIKSAETINDDVKITYSRN